MAAVKNEDVLSLYRRGAKLCYEIRNADSADVSEITDNDFNDFRILFNDYRAHVEFVKDRPQLKLPHAVEQEVAMPLQGDLVENNDCNDLMRLMESCATHLVLSDSARVGSGMQGGDYSDQVSLLDKCDKLFEKIQNSVKSRHPEGNAPGSSMKSGSPKKA